MIPKDDAPKPALPIVGMWTTVTYEGPWTWPRKRPSIAVSEETWAKLQERLELVDGATPIVTFVIDRNTGRTYKKE